MKSNFHWIKIGLLIGLGIVLARFIVPLGLIACLVVLPLVLVVLFLGFVTRSIGNAVGHLKVRQGWIERNRRSTR